MLGAGGIGKTNLCLATLHDPDVAACFGDRRFFVRLEAATSASAAILELATAIGLEPTGGNLQTGVLRSLRESAATVVLDNAETPWEADTLATEDLFSAVAGVPGVALVVSMRGNERPGGPAWADVRIGPLETAHARNLFLSVAGPRFDHPELDALLAEMGGVPLAVELLAHTAEGEPDLATLAQRWRDERVRLLQRGKADHRLLNVAVSVEASWTGPLLTGHARCLLSLLGGLPDGIALADLPALMPNVGLAAANLLRRRGLAFDETGRLRTYPPVRHHLAAAHPPDNDTVWQQTVAHYSNLARELGPMIGQKGGDDAVRRLLSETANLEATLRWALAAGEGDQPCNVVNALCAFVRFTGAGLNGLFLAALETARCGNDVGLHAQTLKDLGNIALARSDHDGARAHFEEALPLYRQVGAVLGEANCIYSLGNIALERSDHDGARAHFEEALPLYRQVGDVLGEANCIMSLGDIALARSDHDAARGRYEEALPLYRQVGTVLGEANCIRSLGDIALARSDHDAARGRYEEALGLYERISEPYSIGWAHRRLADVARSDDQRLFHLSAARAAWTAIHRLDLVAELDEEQSPGDT